MKNKSKFHRNFVWVGFGCVIILVILLSGCPRIEPGKQEEPLARVEDMYFYPSDLPNIFYGNISAEDSAKITKTYIQKWIKNKLLLQKAELNIPTEKQREVLKKLEDTRASLMIYEYQQQMINQKLDTIISQSEINEFYNQHLNNFILDKNIIKTLFVQIPTNSPNIPNVRRWYRSNNSEDLTKLEGYCYQYATKYDYFNENWIPFSMLLNIIPVSVNNQKSYLKYNQYIETSDSLYLYFANIRNYRLKGSNAPVEYINDNIKSIILNNRKIKFLKEIENNIYYDALSRNRFEIY
ncbi:MAG: hypothetical protein IMY71_08635 [Bacteroidetes bacterium]|nr:hypothetical protein [Bacteroidota bacterium]